jgi:hypothetical protein
MAGLMTAAAGQGQHETFQQRFSRREDSSCR